MVANIGETLIRCNNVLYIREAQEEEKDEKKVEVKIETKKEEIDEEN